MDTIEEKFSLTLEELSLISGGQTVFETDDWYVDIPNGETEKYSVIVRNLVGYHVYYCKSRNISKEEAKKTIMNRDSKTDAAIDYYWDKVIIK